jgi:hypothetical protein
VYGISAGHHSGYDCGTTLLKQENGMVYRHASRVLVDLLPRLSGADEGPHGLGKDRPLVVEASSVNGYVAMGQKMGFDNRLKGGFFVCVMAVPPGQTALARAGASRMASCT